MTETLANSEIDSKNIINTQFHFPPEYRGNYIFCYLAIKKEYEFLPQSSALL